MVKLVKFLSCLLFLPLLWAGELESLRNGELAGLLLVYLDSPSVVMARDQWERLKKLKDPVLPLLYGKILEQRKADKESQEEITQKKIEDTEDRYLFSKEDIRKAALQALLELGDDAIPALKNGVLSSRVEVRFGVLQCINQLSDPKANLLRIYEMVLMRDQWGGSEFDSPCRQEAASGLWRYLQDSQGRLLFDTALEDADGLVRYWTMKGLCEAYRSDQLEQKTNDARQLSNYLLKYHRTESAYFAKSVLPINQMAAYVQGGLEHFPTMGENYFIKDEDSLVNYGRCLELIGAEEPGLFAKLSLVQDSWKNDYIACLLLAHGDQLEPVLRKQLLENIFTSHNQLSVLSKALHALRDSDVEWVIPHLKTILEDKKEASILGDTLELIGKWKVRDVLPQVKNIAASEYRKPLRLLAERVVLAIGEQG